MDMQFLKIYLKTKFYLKPSSIFTILVLSFFTISAVAQVNTVEFGKNRVQFKKFKWAYYQTGNFNTYYSQNGEPLAK